MLAMSACNTRLPFAGILPVGRDKLPNLIDETTHLLV